ncbi:hypothetical protein D9M68_782580 [compost metagenome]
MLDQVLEQGIGQPLFIRPLSIAEHAIKGVRVSLLDLSHSPLQCSPYVDRFLTHVLPVAVIRNLESMRLREPAELVIAGLVDDLLVLLIPNVADALEEQ